MGHLLGREIAAGAQGSLNNFKVGNRNEPIATDAAGVGQQSPLE
jgi:hypothetical protein